MLRVIDYFKNDWKKYLSFMAKKYEHLDSDEFRELLLKINNEYLYWSKVKHYAKNTELSENELWAYVKYTRSVGRKEIPIIKNNNFTMAITDKIHELLYGIDNMLLQINKKTQELHPSIFRQYLISGLIEEAIATSQIEGAQTKKRVAKEMLEIGRKPETKHEYMIYNAFHVGNKIKKSDLVKLEIGTIVDIHNDLISNTKDNLKNDDFEIRKEGVEIEDKGKVIYRAPDSKETKNSLDNLVCFFNCNVKNSFFIHPILKGIIVHYWLSYIHPFYDGNGRTARMLFYAFMMNIKGYEIFEYIPISTEIKKKRKDYDKAFLYVEHDEHDLNYFLYFHLEILKNAIEGFSRYINEKKKELNIIENILVKKGLNIRQILIVSKFIRSPESSITVKSHQELNDISRPIATKDLNQLVDMNYLEIVKKTKQHIFKSIPKLKNKVLK